jgi:hypothetical protein
LPVITTTGAAVCINQPAFLLAAGGLTNTTGYTWRGPSGYLSYAQNAQILSATNVSPQTFTVVGTAANSCTNIAFATLSTYPLPNIFAAGATVCYGYPANLNANGAVTYTWAGPNSNNFSGSATAKEVTANRVVISGGGVRISYENGLANPNFVDGPSGGYKAVSFRETE